jgi:hypothetical protein
MGYNNSESLLWACIGTGVAQTDTLSCAVRSESMRNKIHIWRSSSLRKRNVDGLHIAQPQRVNGGFHNR